MIFFKVLFTNIYLDLDFSIFHTISLFLVIFVEYIVSIILTLEMSILASVSFKGRPEFNLLLSLRKTKRLRYSLGYYLIKSMVV